MKDYSGNRTPYIYVMFHEADRERVLPVLEAMEGRGLRFCGVQQQKEQRARKALAVLAFLSESFVRERQDAFFAVKDSGVPLIPIQLEDMQLPEMMQQALYAQNSIMAERYPTAQALADRILTAEVFADPTITPAQKRASRRMLAGLCGGAAAVLLLLALVFLGGGTPEPVVEEVVQTSYENPFDLSREDLERIRSVAIVGEHYRFLTRKDLDNGEDNDLGRLGRRMREGDEINWYWQEDNSRTTMTEYDLDLLLLFPNVQSIFLANIRADGLPDMSGLSQLYEINMQDCQISDIQGLSGSPLAKLLFMHCPIADYSPLSSCGKLTEVSIAQHVYPGADYSNFCPPMLRYLSIDNAPALETPLRLDGLKESTHLKELRLKGFSAASLDGIEGLKSLERLRLEDFHNLRDVAALHTMTKLDTLEIWDAWNLMDVSPIGDCINLQHLTLTGVPSTDTGFMEKLTQLKEIGFHTQGTDLNFLRNLRTKNRIALYCSAPIQDYSGLEAIQSFSDIHINLNGRSYHDLAEPYLSNAVVYDWMELYDCRDVQLDQLPEVRGTLAVQYGDLKNLTGLKKGVKVLELTNAQSLTSLEGLPDVEEISVNGCMRLRDWSALAGKKVARMAIGGTATLPDFGSFRIGDSLTLESIPGLKELNCLTSLQNKQIELRLPGMEESADLSALNCMQGTMLGVPQALELQAMKLVDSGRFEHYLLEFQEGEWRNELRFSLESLEELEELPEAVLSQVSRLCIAGDTLYDPDQQDVRYLWNGQRTEAVLFNRETGEETKVRIGELTDLSGLEKLTGLRELTLVYQPLENLDGIQQLASLVSLDVNFCMDLEDISAAFSLDALENISAHWTNVSSIQGIQNLHRLCSLDLGGTKVTDLSPLGQCGFDYAYQRGGFGLGIDELEPEDLSPLGAVRMYSWLSVNGLKAEARELFEALRMIPIERLETDHMLHSQEDIASLAQALPELRVLNFGGNPDIRDLSPLLDLPNLQELNLNNEMQKQAQELRQQNPRFAVNVR